MVGADVGRAVLGRPKSGRVDIRGVNSTELDLTGFDPKAFGPDSSMV